MKVRVISRKNSAVLVEWVEPGEEGRPHYFRSIVPESELTLTGVREAEHPNPAMGIPYGEPWEELIRVEVSPAQIANEMRRMGIWTLADLRAEPNTARAALQKVLALDVQRIRSAALTRN